eukprot:scaffold13219_cov106-Skeletonema_marinoi.AAC.13
MNEVNAEAESEWCAATASLEERRDLFIPAFCHSGMTDGSHLVAQLFAMKLATDLFSIPSDVLTKIQKDGRSCGAGKV